MCYSVHPRAFSNQLSYRSSGLGLATVRSLLDGGAYTSIVDLSEPPEEVKASPRARFFHTDITDVDAIERTVEGTAAWANETGAPLGGVINCAGVGIAAKIISVDKTGARPPEPHSLDVWNFALNVNLTGTFNLTRLALKYLVYSPPEGEDGERGVIIMVASAAAVRPVFQVRGISLTRPSSSKDSPVRLHTLQLRARS